jgi:Protein of unknown function (DUF3618)
MIEHPGANVTQQIEADIARTRQSLVETMDVLEYRLRPASLLDDVGQRVIGLFRNPDGSLRTVRVAAVGGVALLTVAYLIRRRGA